MSIIRTVDYMNPRISIVAREKVQTSIIMPLNLFIAIQILVYLCFDFTNTPGPN